MEVDGDLTTRHNVFNSIIIITAVFVNISNHEHKIKVSHMKAHSDHWQHITLTRDNFTVNQKIANLSLYGIDANTQNAAELVDFLRTFEELNYSNIQHLYMINQAGWYQDQFITPYDESKFVIDNDSNNFIKSLKCKGDYDKWIEAAKLIFLSPIARFILAASLSAILLKPLHCRTFSVYFWGNSRAGKSTAAKFAASAWGNQDLVKNFNSTNNSFIAELAETSDFPYIVDEKQVSDNKFNAAKLIYDIGESSSRGRADRTGKARERKTWRTIAILNGETPLLEDNSTQGAITRCLSIHFNGEIISDNLAKFLYSDIFEEHYGHKGFEVIQTLQRFIDGDNKQTLKESFKTFYNRLKVKFPNHIDDHIRYCALISTSDFLFLSNQIGDISDIDSRFESSYDNAFYIMRLLQTQDESSDFEREKDFILNWIAEHGAYFQAANPNGDLLNDKRNSFQTFGKWSSDYLYIIAKPLQETLNKSGFSAGKVVHDCIHNCFFIPDDKIEKKARNPRSTVSVRINNTVAKCYRIPISLINPKEESYSD